jgi:hypothetical protein
MLVDEERVREAVRFVEVERKYMTVSEEGSRLPPFCSVLWVFYPLTYSLAL